MDDDDLLAARFEEHRAHLRAVAYRMLGSRAEAARHYDEMELAALLVSIASVNVWNRLNAATRQVAGSYAS